MYQSKLIPGEYLVMDYFAIDVDVSIYCPVLPLIFFRSFSKERLEGTLKIFNHLQYEILLTGFAQSITTFMFHYMKYNAFATIPNLYLPILHSSSQTFLIRVPGYDNTLNDNFNHSTEICGMQEKTLKWMCYFFAQIYQNCAKLDLSRFVKLSGDLFQNRE